MTEFVVIDIELCGPSLGKFLLADVQVPRSGRAEAPVGIADGTPGPRAWARRYSFEPSPISSCPVVRRAWRTHGCGCAITNMLP